MLYIETLVAWCKLHCQCIIGHILAFLQPGVDMSLTLGIIGDGSQPGVFCFRDLLNLIP